MCKTFFVWNQAGYFINNGVCRVHLMIWAVYFEEGSTNGLSQMEQAK